MFLFGLGRGSLPTHVLPLAPPIGSRPASKTTVGLPLPRHSIYILRPPTSMKRPEGAGSGRGKLGRAGRGCAAKNFFVCSSSLFDLQVTETIFSPRSTTVAA